MTICVHNKMCDGAGRYTEHYNYLLLLLLLLFLVIILHPQIRTLIYTSDCLEKTENNWLYIKKEQVLGTCLNWKYRQGLTMRPAVSKIISGQVEAKVIQRKYHSVNQNGDVNATKRCHCQHKHKGNI